MRDEEGIDKTAYRKLYTKAKAGELRNIAHLNEVAKSDNLIKSAR